MKAVFAHLPTGREFVADESAEIVFAGNSETLGVTASWYRPEGGVLVRHMHCAPDEIRSAYRSMVNPSGRGFREEFAVPGSNGWYKALVWRELTAEEAMQHLVECFGFPPATSFDCWIDPETGETVGEHIAARYNE